MKVVSGVFNGTGATLYVGCGFLPDFVNIWNLESATNQLRNEWRYDFRSAEMFEGMRYTETIAGGNITAARLTYGTGIQRYNGGDTITTLSTAYIVEDPADYRTSTTYGTINDWTLGSAANRTGNWNVECDTTYVGVGSQICVMEESKGNLPSWARVVALTSNGEQANEVTLDVALTSGAIVAIRNMYNYKAAAVGTVMPAGFVTLDTTVNVSTNMCLFEAGMYDRAGR